MSNHFNTQIGFGTSNLGNSLEPAQWNKDLAAMRYAIDVGYTVFDTAEMYGDGKTETMLGQALVDSGKRDSLHIVSKVLPKNALTKEDVLAACERSIKKMKCDYIDTYLLHWREGPMPLEPVVEAMLTLKDKGLIKDYGVSNFKKYSLAEWKMIENKMGAKSSYVTDQIRYSISVRDAETELIPWLNENNVTIMAHSPLVNGHIFKNKLFIDIAQRYGYLPAQLAIAWTIRKPGIISIPRSSDPTRIKRNLDSQKLTLNNEILSELDKKFPIV
jgi:diketogulonate reductase-like aldo/keto reductase